MDPLPISQLTESIIAGASFLGVNVVLVTIVIYFGKKWINGIEAKIKDDKIASEESVSTLRNDFSNCMSESSKEVKEMIRENKDVYNQHSLEIKESINSLVEQVKIANGRTHKNELYIENVKSMVKTQIALCQERNGGRRISDRCHGPLIDDGSQQL